ncbi:MAG: helix-turn-helix domain-containing protein, partial [Cyanobacteria bacterium P01_A01_bin.40]
MPKIVDHHRYRKELLAKCFDLFAQRGYGSLTMRQVAKEIGVSTGTLYHYFASKEELFRQLIEEITEQDILRVTD